MAAGASRALCSFVWQTRLTKCSRLEAGRGHVHGKHIYWHAELEMVQRPAVQLLQHRLWRTLSAKYSCANLVICALLRSTLLA